MNPDFDNHPGELSRICCDAAIELDNHIRGRGHGFESVDEFCSIVKKYVPDGNESFTFPYHAVWHAVKKDSDKEIRYMDELALEMALLAGELETVREQPKNKLEEMRDFFVSVSEELMKEDWDYRRYLVA